MQIKPIRFRWNQEGRRINQVSMKDNEEQIGFNAKNIRAVMPEAVGIETHCNDHPTQRPGDRETARNERHFQMEVARIWNADLRERYAHAQGFDNLMSDYAAIDDAIDSSYAPCQDPVDYLSLPHGDRPIVAALVNAVQEQQHEIEQLKAQIAALAARRRSATNAKGRTRPVSSCNLF